MAEHLKEIKYLRPYGKFRGPTIPNRLMRYQNLPASCKLMWGRLAQYLGKNGDAFASYDTLAYEIGVSRRRAITIVQRLEQDGFIELEQRPGRTCLFRFLHHPCLGGDNAAPLESVEWGDKVSPLESDKVSLGGEQECTPGVTKLHPGGELECTRRESPKRISKENHQPPSANDIPAPPDDPEPSLAGGGVCEKSKKHSQLTPDEAIYLSLSVAYQESHGGFKTSKAAFRNWLKHEILEGRRDMSDYQQLVDWQVSTIDETEDEEAGPHAASRRTVDAENSQWVRAEFLTALSGTPPVQEYIQDLYEHGYGGLQLADVRSILRQKFPHIVEALQDTWPPF